MNQTVAYKIYSAPAAHSKNQGHESLLRKVLAALKTISMGCQPKDGSNVQHQNFMDENLLDDLMGPEISRTLRR